MTIPTGYIAGLLGAGMAACLLWWPVCFIAARGTFKFTYKWYFFLLGYVLASFASVPLLHVASRLTISEDYQSLVTGFGVPIAASLIVILSFSMVVKSQRSSEELESKHRFDMKKLKDLLLY